jgi:Uma2 family endonuclease
MVPRALPEFFYGWRIEYVTTPDGKRDPVQIPLTAEEALHPQEGYIMPENTKHAALIDSINEMLQARYANEPETVVFRDLIIEWDVPGLKGHCPDVMVIPHVKDREKKRGKFFVKQEGTRPIFALEVVSESSKDFDRVKKVDQYARAGIQEYVYIDSWPEGKNVFWEIAGFRLTGDHYLPILPDEERSLYCETLGLRIGIKAGKVWMQDYATGEDLMTNVEAQTARRIAEARAEYAEARATEEKAAREALEARVAELEAEIKKEVTTQPE